ncbi:hypothetical protein [Streptomyces sp. NPDC001635]
MGPATTAASGFAALVPEPRKAVPRMPPEVLELAAALTLQPHFVNAG